MQSARSSTRLLRTSSWTVVLTEDLETALYVFERKCAVLREVLLSCSGRYLQRLFAATF